MKHKYEVKYFVTHKGTYPFKKRASDGGFDFYVDLASRPHLLNGVRYTHDQGWFIELKPGDVVKLMTGIHCRFPENTVWQWDVRSSAGLRGFDVTCRTIDCSYLGELSVVLVNNSNETLQIKHHDRIAQLVPNPFSSKYFLTRVDALEELGETDRGHDGFGSSGT